MPSSNFLNVTPLPQWIFTPPPSGHKSTVRITNNSPLPVYYGQANVSQYNGVPIPPRGNVVLPYSTAATYVAGVSTTINTTNLLITPNPPWTMSSTALAAGSTVVTLTAAVTVPTVQNTGSTLYLVLGSAGALEVVQPLGGLNNGFTASSFTIATATLYDHVGSVTVATVQAVPQQVTWTTGVAS